MSNSKSVVLFKGVIQKEDESPCDCQDALASNLQLERYVIADGVGGSFFPSQWAELLVKYFAYGNSSENISLFETQNWRDWLIPIQQKWDNEIREKVAQNTSADAWHLRNSLAQREPAAATFVGLHLNQTNWQAMIIGDSCLFHFRNDQLTSYLIKKSSEFDYHPRHFASIAIHNKHEPKFVSGSLEVGDIFILATDALAKWLLIQYEMSGFIWQEVWNRLIHLDKWRDFYDFIEQARKENEKPLEDDDVTLMIISIGQGKTARNTDPLFNIQEPVSTLSNPAYDPLGPRPKSLKDDTRLERPLPPGRLFTKKERIHKRIMGDVRLVSVLALFIALLSICLSSLNLYLLLSSSTLVSTASPVPTNGTINNDVPLVSGMKIYSDTNINSHIILPINDSNEGQALLVEKIVRENQEWGRIQVDLWTIALSSDGQKYVIGEGDAVIIQKSAKAYLSPTLTVKPIGELLPGVTFQKISENTDENHNQWYQIRLSGFIRLN